MQNLNPSWGGQEPAAIVSRRAMLGGAIALAGGLVGCGRSVGPNTVAALVGSVPPQLPGQFRAARGLGEPTIESFGEPEELFRWLQAGWKGQPPPALVMLGDRWLGAAVRLGLLAAWPGEAGSIDRLDPRWGELLWRDRQGQVSAAPPPNRGSAKTSSQLITNGQGSKNSLWGAPYRWGTVALAYRTDKLEQMGGPLRDWPDLWRPELARRLVLLDRPREMIGAVLKGQGRSLNDPHPQALAKLPAALAALNRQALLYADRDYLQPLLLGDAWVAVGWSTDILAGIDRQPNLAAVVPASGTSLWADLWVRPAQAVASPWVESWAEFSWQEAIARQLLPLINGAPAGFLAHNPLPPAEVSPRGRSLLVPEAGAIARSEFVLPLSAASEAEYATLWQAMRRG